MNMRESYIPRHLAGRLNEFLQQFPIVLLPGARQSGKSTFLKKHLRDWHHLDLEDLSAAQPVLHDPALYLRDHPQNVWFDEAQRAPALFAALRVAIDRDRRPGRYVLSGSASPALLKQVSESLAGRAGILDLGVLSAAEATKRQPPRFLSHVIQSKNLEELLERLATEPRADEATLRGCWLIGGYPEINLLPDAVQRQRWFDAYIRLLSERDLREMASGLHPAALQRLLRMLAARQGQLLNLSALSNEMGVASNTLKSYLDVLEGTFLWRRLPPYFQNVGKRLVKSPKSYLIDSGLLHAMLAFTRFEDLEISPSLGASWEGWIITQLEAQSRLLDSPMHFYFWRTHAGAEVDLVMENGLAVYGFELKWSSQINTRELRGLRQFLADHSDRARYGCILYRGTELARLEENILLVPITSAV